jgi:hypothetical protein
VPLNEQELFIRIAKFRYNLQLQTEALMRAQLRLENGRKGSEAGLNKITPNRFLHPGDPQAYSDAWAADGAEQHIRLARRILKEMQREVFRDKATRTRFLVRYAANYLRGGNKARSKKDKAAENWKYYESLEKIWQEEMVKLEKRDNDAGYNPWEPCDGTRTRNP